MTHPIAPYAAEAWTAGYAIYGPTPLSERARASCGALISLACENAHEPNVLAHVAETAKYEGLVAICEARRYAASAVWAAKTRDLTTKIAKVFPERWATDVHGTLKHFGLATEAVLTDQRNHAKEAALVALKRLLKTHDELSQEFLELNAGARAAAIAEGIAEAQALTANAAGAGLVDLDQAFSDTLTHLRQLDSYWSGTKSWLSDEMQGLAGDMGRTIADGIARNFGPTDLVQAVNDVIAQGDGAQFYIDEAIHTAMQGAALGEFAQTMTTVDFATQGDGNVCLGCLGDEAGSPYDIELVPGIPAHGGCRCFYAPAGTVS